MSWLCRFASASRSGPPGGTSISADFVLGVTGKYCSGKNTLVSFLRESGFREIDVDRLGHRALAEDRVKSELRRHFGAGVFAVDGTIDRHALGRVVFAKKRNLRVLESIVHPAMVARVEQLLGRLDGPVVINAAILYRMRLERFCQAVVCVRAPLLQSLRRARRRDGTGVCRALRRIRAQRGICSKLNANEVDIYYVDNDRALDHLHTQILQILNEKGLVVQ